MPRKQPTKTKKCGEFSNDDRKRILHHLLQNVQDYTSNKLKRGAINTAAEKFCCSRSTISKLWKQIKVCKINNVMINVDSHKKKCGRKPKDYSQQIKNISTIPFCKRSTLRSLAHESKIPKSTLHDRLKKGKEIKRVTSFVKPLLTDENKHQRSSTLMTSIKCDENAIKTAQEFFQNNV